MKLNVTGVVFSSRNLRHTWSALNDIFVLLNAGMSIEELGEMARLSREHDSFKAEGEFCEHLLREESITIDHRLKVWWNCSIIDTRGGRISSCPYPARCCANKIESERFKELLEVSNGRGRVTF